MSTHHFIVNYPPQGPAGGQAAQAAFVSPGSASTAAHPLLWGREAGRSRVLPVRPTVPGLEYYASGRSAGVARPASSVDYLDYFETDGGNFGLAIGDIAGGGASSGLGSLLVNALHGMIRGLGTPQSDGLGALVQSIHELFYELSTGDGYATLFVGRFDPVTRRLDYCNAGHEAPVVLRKCGPAQPAGGWAPRRAIRLESSGPVIGLLRRSVYRQGSIQLQPGDILAAYSDGLCEASNAAGEEWGYRRMLGTLEASADGPVEEIVEGVLAEAQRFTGGAPPTDDMTLWIGRLEKAQAAETDHEAEAAELAAMAA